MAEIKDENKIDVKSVSVCAYCRHHQHNPYLEYNFSDSKIYFMCPNCTTMNTMDVSKPLPGKYPKPRGI